MHQLPIGEESNPAFHLDEYSPRTVDARDKRATGRRYRMVSGEGGRRRECTQEEKE